MRRTLNRGYFRVNACMMGLFLCCGGVSSCSGDDEPAKGQLMISVQTDMSIPKDVDSIRVEISAYGNLLFANSYDVGPSALLIPATLALVAGEDPGMPVRIRVIARQNGKLRTLREAVTTVPRDRIATLRMPIEWLCDGQVRETASGNVESMCPGGETCVAGLCESVQVDSETLETYDSQSVFGGGSGVGDGVCFDTVACFSEGAGIAAKVSADGSCGFDKPSGAENINLAIVLKPGSDGICGPEACLIPLDAGGNSGWHEDNGRILLPRAVCDRIEDDENRVVGLALTTSCETKTESMPTCGPWSSVTTNPGQFDAGPPDVLELRDAGSEVEVDAQPEAEPDVVAEAEPDVVAEAEPDVVVEAEPDVVVEAEPDVVVEAESDVSLDVAPDVEPLSVEVCPGLEMELEQNYGSVTKDTSECSTAYADAYSSSECGLPGGKQFVVNVTPDETGMLSCWLFQQDPPWESVLYARSDCNDASSELDCNEDFGEGMQMVEFPVEASKTYYLFVDGDGPGQEGPFDLHCSFMSVICNDLEQVGPGGFCVAKSVAMPMGWAIDATQVTRRQYDRWLDMWPSTGDQPSYCTWNTDYSVQGFGSWDDPVTGVDWCDAYAYCRAVGKRLCGKIGEQENDFADYAEANLSQWYAACSSGGVNAYPYGNIFDPLACNGLGSGNQGLTEVGSLQGCQSSHSDYEGVFDLSGNVWEWEDSCEGSTGEDDRCRLRGGSVALGAEELECASEHAVLRYETDSRTGFRCCSH